MFMEDSIPCSIAETWRIVQMKWPRVNRDRTEQHREVVPGGTRRQRKESIENL